MNAIDHVQLKRCLVTGASGFIGRNLCPKLTQLGIEVHGLSRTLRATTDNSVARWWQGDATDLGRLREIVDCVSPDTIFHLVGEVTASRAFDLVLPTFEANLCSTVNALIAATEAKCRLILAGSFEEHEEPDTVPSSPYAAAKWAASGYARMFHELYGTAVVTARIFMTYGPEENLHRVIAYVIEALLREESPRLSSGSRPVDWIYVADVVEGLIAAAETRGVEGCTFEFGSGVLVTIRDLVLKIVRITGSQIPPLFGALPERPRERVRAANTAEALSKLGWSARTSLDVGLGLTVAWHRKRLTRLEAGTAP